MSLLGTILLIALIVFLIGGVGPWAPGGYGYGFGHGGAVVITVVLLVVLILVMLGRL